MNPLPRIIAVFPEIKRVSEYLTECRLVVTMMTGNSYFTSPTPTLPLVSAHLDVLEASEELAHKGGTGAVEQRDVDLSVVRRDMRLLKAYVQNTADSNLNEAASIIASAGMSPAKMRKALVKPPVGVRTGNVPGRALLECKALSRPVQYRWQMSTDQKSWTDLPESFLAKVTVDGLTPATVYYFRLRTMTRDGLSDWSVVVSLIAH